MPKKLRYILGIPEDFFQMICVYFPGPIGYKLRYLFWKRRLRHAGKRVKIDVGVHFQNPGWISLGDDCWIDRNVVVLAGPPWSGRITHQIENPRFPLNAGEVSIGEMSHIAPNCVLSGIGGIYIGRNAGVASNSAIYSYSHHYRNLEDRGDRCQYSFTPLARRDQQSMILGPVFIGDYCAVGLSSVILPGASIEKGTWIASGSVITGTHSTQSLVFPERQMQTKSLSDFVIVE
ncbi:MAG: DapH/DapD/GlmU-related protein [Thermodesulfobacteriota bacterium]|nr:DapH/DapD/GlmU-related protein [Thermodesulfobacteriota bacterium]